MNTRQIAAEYRMMQWAEIIQDRKASGERVADYCVNRGLSRDSYFYYQRKLREAAFSQIAEFYDGDDEPAGIVPLGFAEVRPRVSTANRTEVARGPKQGVVRVEIADIRITASAAYPAATLTELLKGLMAPC